MQKRIFMSILALLLCLTSPAFAHNFFVNITESMAHPSGSIVTNIGWGHGIPMNDFFTGDKLKTYGIYDPDLKKMDFLFDPKANLGVEQDKGKADSNFPGGNMLSGDMYCRNVRFSKDAPQGTYQFAATTNKIQFAVWKDAKGREKWGRVTLDKIKDAKKIDTCFQYQSFAKSFVSVGQWSEPKPLGHDLRCLSR